MILQLIPMIIQNSLYSEYKQIVGLEMLIDKLGPNAAQHLNTSYL